MMTDKIKELISKKQSEPSKKRIENIVFFIVVLIITVIAINIIWGKNGSSEEKHSPVSDGNKKLATDVQEVQTSSETNQDDTVNKLEEILSKIDGVGKVKVMLTYSQTSQTVPLYNQDSSEKSTEESDKQGGTRKVTETDTKTEIIYKEENGEKLPITQSVISPKIEGAIITAQGAGNSLIKTNIVQAVEAVTGVASHKIQVFQMSKE